MIQSLKTIIVAALKADPTIAQITGGRIYGAIMTDTHAFPCTTMQRISGKQSKNIDRTICGVATARIRITSWAQRDSTTAEQLCQLVTNCLHSYSSSVADFNQANEGENFDDADKAYGYYVDMMVTYQVGQMR